MAKFRKAPKPAPAPAPAPLQTSIDITGTNGDDDLKASNLGSIKTNNIFGLDGNDKLTGDSVAADTLDGGAGNDLIRDSSNEDVSNDLLIGGTGNDTINSSGGADRLEGGDGADYLLALGAGSSLSGGTGDDHFHLGSLAIDSVIDGGAGLDFAAITTGSSSNTALDIDLSNLNGGTFHFAAGNVTVVNVEAFDIRTGYGNDRIVLTANNDAASGGEGNDIISGLGGNDSLHGGRGADVIDGGAGNDRIEGFDGHDSLTGGDGADAFVFGLDTAISFQNRNSDVITDFNAAEGDLIDLTTYFQSSLSPDGDPIGRPLNIADAVNFIDTANGVEVHLVASNTVAAVLEGLTATDLSYDIFTF